MLMNMAFNITAVGILLVLMRDRLGTWGLLVCSVAYVI